MFSKERFQSPANSDGDDSAYASMYSAGESEGARSPQWQPRLGPVGALGSTSSNNAGTTSVFSVSSATAAGTTVASAPKQAALNSTGDASLDSLKAQMDAAFAFSGGFAIKVLGVPLQNARSRVETQTKLCLQMVDVLGNKTSAWSHLRLPEQLVTKEKLRKSQNVVDYSLIPLNKVLDLQAVIICASDPKKDVQICSGCQQRELKRSKKKSEPAASVTSPNADVKMEDVGSLNLDLNGNTSAAAADNDAGKIVLFNCGSYVDFSSGDTILPTRITCYCRHHNEKTGFCVYFIARDHNSNVIATGISPPILITDDHKGTKSKTAAAIPATTTAGQKRSRTDEFLADMIPELSMLNNPTSPPNTVVRQNNNMQDDIIAQFIPALLASESNAPLFENFGIRSNSEGDSDFRRTKKQFQSPPPQASFAPTVPTVPTAIINRIIPGEGPIQGGVEITILGENIHNGLIAVFGDLEAITTQVWGTSTMICILPPSSTPGPVPVTLKALAGFPANTGVPDIPVTFMYKDDLDRSLMELALQVVGLRMTGSLDSARNIAMRIVNETAQETIHDSSLTFTELARNQLETAILNALFSLEEHSVQQESQPQVVLTSLLDMTFHGSNGLNMLHIASLAGMTTLVKYLISLDCDVDPRDRNGFTPLMFAVQAGQWPTVGILVKAGASTLLTSKNGVSCFALAKRRTGGVEAFVKVLEGAVKEGIFSEDAADEEEDEEEEEVEAEEVPAPVPEVERKSVTRMNSTGGVFSVPAVPEFVASKPTAASALPIDKLVAELCAAPLPSTLSLRKGSKASLGAIPKGSSKLNEITNQRWTNPEEELKNIMDGFKMFSFLGPLVHTMATPLIVNRVDVNYSNLFTSAELQGLHGDKVRKVNGKKLQQQLDRTVSVVPFSGFVDEDMCCESWNNGLGTHQYACKQAKKLRRAERKQRRKQRALWIFWLPLFTLIMMLLLIWVMVPEEELGALLDKLLGWNDGVVNKVKNTVHGLKHDGKNLILEFLNAGFGQL
ncbi:SPT3 Dosage dependent suppressor of Ty-induced promoter mutations-like protein [Rhizoclosmatium hyalinum]|nr:SPT3 Dosage dependent suppressor of Ty-induced promoter mutations-like protein [Rhizoclosmatium hyalinum]